MKREIKHYCNIFLVFCFFISCQKDQKCSISEDGISKINFFNKEINFKYWNAATSNQKYDLYVSSVNNNQLLFDRFLDKNSVEKSFAIIFYVDGDQKDWIRKRSINANNVKAYQLYFGKENTIKTDIYKNNKGKCEKIKKLSSAVNYISANDMYKIAKLFSGTTSIFMLENINESFNYIDFKPNSLREYELESNIRTYLIEEGARER